MDLSKLAKKRFADVILHIPTLKLYYLGDLQRAFNTIKTQEKKLLFLGKNQKKKYYSDLGEMLTSYDFDVKKISKDVNYDMRMETLYMPIYERGVQTYDRYPNEADKRRFEKARLFVLDIENVFLPVACRPLIRGYKQIIDLHARYDAFNLID